MLNRQLIVTALASFLALGTQSAFAEPGADNAPNATAAAPATTSNSSQAGTQAGISTPASAIKVGRARHAARIPGTFALTNPDGSRNDNLDQATLHVMLSALSGDGGG